MARSRTRDPEKRLMALGVPIVYIVKLERMIGVRTGEAPNYFQKLQRSNEIIKAIDHWTRGVVLSDEDWMSIRAEIDTNKADQKK